MKAQPFPVVAGRFLVTGLLLLGGGVLAEAGERLGPTLRSGSGQFVVAAVPVEARAPVAAERNAEMGWIDLEGPLLVLTCERVKKALLWELGAADAWRGTVYVVVNPAMTNNQPAAIGAQAFVQGWQYRLELPRRMEPSALVRGIVHALVLEMANRQAGERSAEVPLWLSEGLALHLSRSSLMDLAVAPPQQTINRVDVTSVLRETRRPDPLAAARERLQAHAAMSLSRMGEVAPESLAPETWKTFQASAQLFVHQLLQLPGGRGRLQATIHRLPTVLNWQNAFLQSFQPMFPRMLDAEKWWSVVLIHFTGQDPLNAWSATEAQARLAGVLQPPVLQRWGEVQSPKRTQVSLQEILKEWEFVRQVQVIQGAVNQLAMISVKLPPELVALAEEYRRVLGDYLAVRSRPLVLRPGRVVADTVRQLDELDARRLGLRDAGTGVLQSGSGGDSRSP